ncbi:methionine synthase reductase, mitochondrial precursor-like protein [Leishmania tarentolae]|uniref:NADPH--hemoprotein reductase n=1 Tax=Leishmania tarentolae TaxID=5689 RepID=A0A640KWG5_LEITA|nr:methionine synthase reductase, mitochondrial precursor-like protein [Leishmania tarentolae]
MDDKALDVDAAERLYVLYGSETGNAESIAKRLHHDATTIHGFSDAVCMTLNEAVVMKLFDAHFAEDVSKRLCAVIVCSTTGDGEPPQNAARFRRWLRNTTGTLHNIRYCVLALGDTNYCNFCAPGIFMDKKLRGMGAVCFYPRGEADDGVGLHLVVNPWLEGLWAALQTRGTEGTAAAGKERDSTGEAHIDVPAAQVAALLYSNASQLCTVTALYLHERITELGGNSDLYPIDHFSPGTSLRRPPEVLLFVLSSENDADTVSEQGTCDAEQLPPLGPFSAWISGSDPSLPLPAETAQLQRWMADPSIRFFNSLFISRKPDDASRAVALDANLRAIAMNCKVEFLCQRQLSGEVPSVAVSAAAVFLWVEEVLHNLPGATADAQLIRRTMEHSFDNCVGVAFGAEQASEVRNGQGTERVNAVKNGSVSTHPGQQLYQLDNEDTAHSSSNAKQASFTNGVSLSAITLNRTDEVVENLWTPSVLLYSGKSSSVKRSTMNMFRDLSHYPLRSSIREHSNFQQMGFPLCCTFVFVVCGVPPTPMAQVVKVLRTLQGQRKQIGGVSFAIVGIHKISESEQFNTCALEVQTLLLGVKDSQRDGTGLGDMDGSTLAPIIQFWRVSLWRAIMQPMESAACLDIASLSIQPQRSVASVTPRDRSVGATLPLAGALVGESVELGRNGSSDGSGNHGVLEPSGVGDFVSASASSALLSLPGSVHPRRASEPGALSLVDVSGSSMLGACSTSTTVVGCAAPGSDKTEATAFGAGLSDSLLPCDPTPLPRENARHTPVILLYASADVSKALDTHTRPSAEKNGFLTAIQSSVSFPLVDHHYDRNVVLLCEAGPEGQSSGGRRLKRFLTNLSHHPDALLSVQFAGLRLRLTTGTVASPVFRETKRLSWLQVTRMVPVLIMPCMSLLRLLGTPWIDCMLSSMALLPPLVVVRAHSSARDAYGASEVTVAPSHLNTAAAGEAAHPASALGVGHSNTDVDCVEVVEEASEDVESCEASMESNTATRVDGVVRSWKLLTCPTARDPVVQLDFSVSVGTYWVPGQTIAVLPCNNVAEVEALLHLFCLKRDEPFLHPASAGPGASVFPTSPLYEAAAFPVSCETVLLRYVDLRITGIHKPFFQLLEQHCASGEAKAAVREIYKKLVTDRRPRDLREVLEAVVAVANCLPPFRHVVENLSLMRPRQYSICSSYRADVTTLSICFKVVEKGICTGWMYDQCLCAAGLPLTFVACADPLHTKRNTARSDVRQLVLSNTVIQAKRRIVIPFVIRSASVFRMPRDQRVPMILIGSGTGIAPFRAFLQEREAWLAEHQLQSGFTSGKRKFWGSLVKEPTHRVRAVCGPIDVFFGCRCSDEDYLFRDELSNWEGSGVIHSLIVAFSREGNDGGVRNGGYYVQDKMQECGVALMDLILHRKACVFVCGDADGMVKEVHKTLRDLIRQHLSLTDAAAATYLEQMRHDGRYLCDVWSTGV